MTKPVLAEAAVITAFGAVATAFALNLADHHVSIPTILAVVLLFLYAGLQQADELGRALATHLYRCPAKGCPVTIRAPKTLDADALRHYRAQATEHTLHTQAGPR
ncbi:hypothetical protein [Streptomyces alfalfae]